MSSFKSRELQRGNVDGRVWKDACLPYLQEARMWYGNDRYHPFGLEYNSNDILDNICL